MFTEPATVGIGVGRNSPTQPKDTCLNIRATDEFVVNLVPFSVRALILLSQNVAAAAAENQIIEEIQILAHGGPDESQVARG